MLTIFIEAFRKGGQEGEIASLDQSVHYGNCVESLNGYGNHTL